MQRQHHDNDEGMMTTMAAMQSNASKGERIESNMWMLMLSMQIQQTAQQISMQQQMFLQQMQMHMSAMEKHADTSEKYLWRITNFMTIHDSKRKRDGIDEEDNDSSDDDK
jgi:hypothetical protein